MQERKLIIQFLKDVIEGGSYGKNVFICQPYLNRLFVWILTSP